MAHHQEKASKGFYLRKAIHLIGGAVLVIIGNFTIQQYGIQTTLSLAATLLLLTMIGEFLRVEYNIFPWSHAIAKEKEKHHFSSVTYALAAFIILIAVVDHRIALAAIAIAIIGDGVAAIIGMTHGKHPTSINPNKTWEGFAANIIAGIIVSLLFVSLPLGIIMALVASTIELSCSHIEDNFFTPLITAAVGTLVSIL